MIQNEEIEMVTVDELLERTLNTDFSSDDRGQILMARYIRRLKNAVIGSSHQKENVFNHNFVPTLLTMLNNEAFDVSVRTDVAIIVGSLAKSKTDNVQILIDYRVIPLLLEGLRTPSKPFVDACLRALRTIYQSKNAPVDDIYGDPSMVTRLLSVAHNTLCSQECVGAILMKSCVAKRYQNLLQSQGVITCFAPLLFSAVPQVKIVALGVFAAIIRNNREVSEVVAYTSHMGCPILEQIRRILTQENELDVHLEAAKCVTYLCRSGAVLTTDFLVVKKVMPMLVRTCRLENNPHVKTRQRVVSCETLAHLIEEDLSLQRLTSWNNMCLQVMSQCLNCNHVETMITDETEKNDLLDELHQSAVLVLAALASNDEDIRRKIAQEVANLLDHIMRGLYRNNELIQLASTKCLHAFSRSVEQIRTVFMDKPVSRQLLLLMQSDNAEISASATAVVANLLLEFSPCKTALIEAGCIPILCDLAKCEEISPRLNGVWALMNLAFRADDKVKSSILRYFTPADMLRALTESPTDSPVACRLLGLIRNLLSHKEHTDQMMSVWGTSVIQIVIFVLEGDYCAEDKEQALNVLANVSYGNSAKDFIISNEDVLRKITNYIMHSNQKFQIAAAFTVCNLVWKDDPGYLERQTKLKELGINKLLHQLLTTKDTILFDKVKMALQNLS